MCLCWEWYQVITCSRITWYRKPKILHYKSFEEETGSDTHKDWNTEFEHIWQWEVCDLIKWRLQGKHGEDVNISALSFEAICSPVPSKVSLHEHPRLQNLDLANCISGYMNSQDNIDVLISSDYYWDIIAGEVASGDEKLVAISSTFGWLLSRPKKGNTRTAHFTTSNLIV